MGLFEKLLRPTPFYKTYKQYLERKSEREQRKLEETFHPLRVSFYRDLIQPGELVFDIGANVGNRVSSFLECGAKVVAVDPQPSCIKTLQEKFGNKIVIEGVGVGATAGELEMQIATDTTVSSFNKEYIENTKDRFKYTNWTSSIKVPVITLEDLIKKYGVPAFCKIDVEGYELEVLKGLRQPIPMISLEYCVPEMHVQIIECINYLNKLAPDGRYNYSIGESMTWAKPEWMDYKRFLEHLNSPAFIQTSFGDIYFKSKS